MIVHLKISRSLESLSLLVWILCMLIILGHCAAAINSTFSCIAKERQALLSFKKGLIVDENLLSSWDSEDLDCCNWIGIRCSKKNGHVVSLDIGPRFMCKNITTCWPNIKGEIGTSLLNLTHLNYLDLSYNNFTEIPEFFGSLNRLRYLNISHNYYLTVVPQHFGNLSVLQYLDLSRNSALNVETLEWISHLSSLEYLNMNYVNLSTTRDCFQSVTKLPLLRKLHLEFSSFTVPWSVKDFNSSKFLQEVHIFYGNLSSPTFYRWLNASASELIYLRIVDVGLHGSLSDFLRNLISLEHLDLSQNGLRGPIPNFLGNMSSLEYIDLTTNHLQGEIPKSVRSLCNLRTLDLSGNELNGSNDFFDSINGCTKNYHLRELRIGYNQFMGSPPDLSRLSSLEVLEISKNNFNGSLKESIFWNLPNLTHLDMSSTSLVGVISEGHFSKLSKLKFLNLQDNSFILKFGDDWVPPFQLNILLFGACKLSDPHFPNWLRTQRSLVKLDISNSGISDAVPTWFWNISSQLTMLNLSHNKISGPAPNCLFCEVYDLNNNQFHSPLPQVSSDIQILNLSRNKFSGSMSFLCTQKFEILWFLDFSNNLFSGNLTDCWMSSGFLTMLNLENNNFSGELPSTLKSCTELLFLSLEQNQLYGKIPTWIGASLTKLMFLGLKSNKFWGSIPSNLCHLQSIKILDISVNSISGTIPSCLNNFTTLTVEESTTMSHVVYTYFPDTDEDIPLLDPLWLMWKGKMFEFPVRTFDSLNYIDLSCNKLSGEIPEEITGLSQLNSLNLSGNKLTGAIPKHIGHLRQLDFLDLSANHLSGRIPESIDNLSFLGWLNLSYNYLSGPIPTGRHLQTFDESSFIGNPQLCGLPLKVECPVRSSPGEGTTRSNSSLGDHEQWYKNTGIWISVVLGFLVGFHGVCGPLLYSASWRTAYYQFLNKIKDGLWVFVAVNIARSKRQFQQRM